MSVYRVKHSYETIDGFQRLNVELVEAESERAAVRVAEGLLALFKRQFRLRKVRFVEVQLLTESPGPYVTRALDVDLVSGFKSRSVGTPAFY